MTKQELINALTIVENYGVSAPNDCSPIVTFVVSRNFPYGNTRASYKGEYLSLGPYNVYDVSNIEPSEIYLLVGEQPAVTNQNIMDDIEDYPDNTPVFVDDDLGSHPLKEVYFDEHTHEFVIVY